VGLREIEKCLFGSNFNQFDINCFKPLDKFKVAVCFERLKH